MLLTFFHIEINQFNSMTAVCLQKIDPNGSILQVRDDVVSYHWYAVLTVLLYHTVEIETGETWLEGSQLIVDLLLWFP